MTALTLARDGDTHIIGRRRFSAPPQALWRAHTEADLVQRWLLGPPGWTMPACVCEAWPGGQIRYDWAHPDGRGFYLTGAFVSLEPFSRIVHIERMHLPQTTPDSRVETLFDADGDGTLMTIRMSLPDRATREMMMSSGMEAGMEASYSRLETSGLLQSETADA